MSGTTVEVQHADRLGSIRAVSDARGTVIASYRTDEFGVPTASTGASGSPFHYTGEPLDASGLTYLRARHYDPLIGRFMSRDPFAGFAAAPLSLNRYSYVGNNPATWSDPNGLTPLSKVMTDGISNALWWTYGLLTTDRCGPERPGGEPTCVSLVIPFGPSRIGGIPHANSLSTSKISQGYSLRNIDTDAVLKYGETTLGAARYSQRFLIDNNAYLKFEVSGTKVYARSTTRS